MKKLLLLLAVMLTSCVILSQSTPIYLDDFESYTIGDYLASENPAWWTTWSNLPGTSEDGLISGDYASSGAKSVLVDNVPGETDLVLKLGDRTTGKYDLSWKMYFENSCGGYYNIQHFEAVATEWAFEMWFNGDGGGTLYAGGLEYNFTYPKAAWFSVKHFIDLDDDWVRLMVNGAIVHEWPFSYQASVATGTKQLGGVDFFAATLDGSTPKYYVDDMSFEEIELLPYYLDDFESYTTGDYLAVKNPVWWTTWSNLPGTSEDGLISGDYASSGAKSVLVDNVPGETDLVLKLGDRTTGKYDLSWKMYFENSCGGYYNIQHFEAVATEWAFEMWFNGDGSGTLYAGGLEYNFTYPKAAWFSVKHFIDLDDDWVRLMVNGAIVHEWPFSYQASVATGTKQLGGVDFFAATLDGSTPKYYVDNMSFLPSGTASIPLSNWPVAMAAVLIACFTLFIWWRRR